jgi:hypothetical protein
MVSFLGAVYNKNTCGLGKLAAKKLATNFIKASDLSNENRRGWRVVEIDPF